MLSYNVYINKQWYFFCVDYSIINSNGCGILWGCFCVAFSFKSRFHRRTRTRLSPCLRVTWTLAVIGLPVSRCLHVVLALQRRERPSLLTGQARCSTADLHVSEVVVTSPTVQILTDGNGMLATFKLHAVHRFLKVLEKIFLFPGSEKFWKTKLGLEKFGSRCHSVILTVLEF